MEGKTLYFQSKWAVYHMNYVGKFSFIPKCNIHMYCDNCLLTGSAVIHTRSYKCFSA